MVLRCPRIWRCPEEVTDRCSGNSSASRVLAHMLVPSDGHIFALLVAAQLYEGILGKLP